MIEIIQKNYCKSSSFFVKENHLREDFTATVVGHILKQNLIRNDTVRRHYLYAQMDIIVCWR